MPGVDYVKVTEVMIQPEAPFEPDEVFALDGELVPLARLELRVLPARYTTVVSLSHTSTSAPPPLPKDRASRESSRAQFTPPPPLS